MPGENFDITEGPPPTDTAPVARPFLGVNFACCGVYSRIYRTADGKAYMGHCPRCIRPIRVEIRPGGSSERFFTVQ